MIKLKRKCDRTVERDTSVQRGHLINKLGEEQCNDSLVVRGAGGERRELFEALSKCHTLQFTFHTRTYIPPEPDLFAL